MLAGHYEIRFLVLMWSSILYVLLPPARRVAQYLLNDLNKVGDPFVPVLHDHQRIQGTAVHELLAEVLAYPPQAMHLVLLSRRDPPFARRPAVS